MRFVKTIALTTKGAQWRFVVANFHLTPAIIELAYELLRGTLPYRRWKLPEVDDVIFHATKIRGCYGDSQHTHDGPGRGTVRRDFTIRINVEDGNTLSGLLAILAHEMIHLADDVAWHRNDVAHGRAFKTREKLVRRYHDFSYHELWQ